MIFGKSYESAMTFPKRIRPPAHTIGTQVLLWVNIAGILLAALFLTSDYRRDLMERLREKHIALHEEAMTLMPAVLQIRRYGRDEIQDYVDAVCSQMSLRDSGSRRCSLRRGRVAW